MVLVSIGQRLLSMPDCALVLRCMPVVLVLLMTGNEGLSALCGLAALVPYYGVLYLCRDRIRRQLTFYLE